MRVVLDTNVLVAAVRSRRGASFQVLTRVGSDEFEVAVSVPLVLEYEDVLVRHLDATTLDVTDVANMINYVCSVAVRQDIFFLWRPQLRDPADDLVLELAVAANCDAIVTHNIRDFAGADRFGIRISSPSMFLAALRSKK